MTKFRFVVVPMFLGLAVASMPLVAEAATDPTAACIEKKLKAASKAVQKGLACYRKAVKAGTAVDTECLDDVEAKQRATHAKAIAGGSCPAEGDADRAVASVDALIARTRIALVKSEVASSCTEKKLKAAGARGSKALRAHGLAVRKADAEKLAKGAPKIQEKFAKDFTKSEQKGDCHTTADSATVAGLVDSSVDALLALVSVVEFETVTIASDAEPAETPGTAGVDVNDFPSVAAQLGPGADLNRAIYTRFYYQPDNVAPDAVLVLVPGFEGGALSFKILAENLVTRAMENGVRVEVWAYDRRGHHLEDLLGQDIAEAEGDAQLLLDWYYGAELGLPLDPRLPRRAIFHGPQAETAFIANWTERVFSKDIDAIVTAAAAASGNNAFLGGHSAGTGFTARYAASDFDDTPFVDAGYAKLRGLVLLEGGGGSASGTPLTEAELDLIEDKADGGLFHAVHDNAPRCVDGTACSSNGDCAGLGRGTCVEPTVAYSIVPGLLNPRVLAAGEVSALQSIDDPDTGENLVTVDQGSGSAVDLVPDLGGLGILPISTAYAGLGSFVDDDGFVSSFATFVRTSVGAPGPTVDGVLTWLDITEVEMPGSVLPDNGPAPTTTPTSEWGVETEVTRMDRLVETFFVGGSNFTDWYYAASGLGTTNGLPGMDSTQITVDRGRPDIENMTEAANINIPVLCLGASNGLTSTPSDFLAFAQSIGTCTAPSCDGTTPRVVDDSVPNPAFPTLGDVNGGFEVFISEGMAHVDIVTAEDDADNLVIGPMVDFLLRNMQ